MTNSPYSATLAQFAGADNATKESETTKYILEAMVDRFGAAVVLGALAELCGDKAEHVRSNNGAADRTAKAWDVAGAAVLKVALSAALEVR